MWNRRNELTVDPVAVVHTDRDDNIRVISARGASRRERKLFEEEIE
jgi:uncharacterized DUF497 family protein